MDGPTERPIPVSIADKAELLRILEEVERLSGFEPIPDATAQQARQMMLDAGIRPEDNLFSRDIIRCRGGE
jgi:hypothetical protein